MQPSALLRRRISPKDILTRQPKINPAAVSHLLEWGKKELRFLNETEAASEAEWFLQEITGLDRTGLYLEARQVLSRVQVSRFKRLISRRQERIPAAYLLKKAFFWSEEIAVTPACLIPRPETEILISSFIEQSGFEKSDRFSFIDIGSGSGAIGIALLRYFERALGTFADISSEALRMTKKNLKSYDLLGRAEIVRSDLFKAFKHSRKWDAVISNPPYLSEADWKKVQPELLYEPKRALVAGPEGTEFYSRMMTEAPAHLSVSGVIALEIGRGQAKCVTELIRTKSFFKTIQSFKDFSGIERVILAKA